MSVKPQIQIFKSQASMITGFINLWQDVAREALIHTGRFTIAVSGGKTPIPYFKGLADKIPATIWQNTHLFLVDERHVPFTDPDSNYGMIQKNLLDRLEMSESNLHPIPYEKTAELSAKAYEAGLKQFFGNASLPEFDFIMLGLGTDGHTASLFPKNPALKEMMKWTASAEQTDVPHRRITLTYPVLNAAKNVVFVVEGEEKSQRIKDIVSDRKKAYPATQIQTTTGKLIWMLDDQAASLLSK